MDSTLFREPRTGALLECRDDGWACPASGEVYPVVRGVARFCPPSSYAENFGDQWNVFSKTQLDSELLDELSANRLWQGTEWNPADLAGKRLLEIGCGAGRFTGVFLAAGAEVWSVDLSSAVDACFENHGSNPHLQIAQADIFALPFAPGTFDYVFMYGVMQHTPDPEGALRIAVDMAAPGGSIAVDLYHKKARAGRLTSKYRWRWLTTRLPPKTLRRIVSWYIPRWLPVDDWLARRSPRFCERVASIIPCWNYRGALPLTEEQRVEWAVLDTYDALGARYDRPYTRREFARCLNAIEGIRFWVKRGGNGLETGIRKEGGAPAA